MALLDKYPSIVQQAGATLDEIRSVVYGTLRSKAGNGLLPVRLVRGAALYANDVVGRPFAPAQEIAERREFEARRDQDRAAKAARVQAPIVVFHIDRHPRELLKVKQMLDGADLRYDVRDISEDEASVSAVKLEMKSFGFPAVFIAGDCVGNAQQLANLEQTGKLETLAFGE